MVPVTVVQHFLEDIRRHGRYTGWCSIGIHFCPLENSAFREVLELESPLLSSLPSSSSSLPSSSSSRALPIGDKADVEIGRAVRTGVMVHHVEATGCAQGHLRKGDVLLAMDGVAIATDGTVPFRRGERVSLSHHVSFGFAGDVAQCTILRNG